MNFLVFDGNGWVTHWRWTPGGYVQVRWIGKGSYWRGNSDRGYGFVRDKEAN